MESEYGVTSTLTEDSPATFELTVREDSIIAMRVQTYNQSELTFASGLLATLASPSLGLLFSPLLRRGIKPLPRSQKSPGRSRSKMR